MNFTLTDFARGLGCSCRLGIAPAGSRACERTVALRAHDLGGRARASLWRRAQRPRGGRRCMERRARARSSCRKRWIQATIASRASHAPGRSPHRRIENPYPRKSADGRMTGPRHGPLAAAAGLLEAGAASRLRSTGARADVSMTSHRFISFFGKMTSQLQPAVQGSTVREESWTAHLWAVR